MAVAHQYIVPQISTGILQHKVVLEVVAEVVDQSIVNQRVCQPQIVIGMRTAVRPPTLLPAIVTISHMYVTMMGYVRMGRIHPFVVIAKEVLHATIMAYAMVVRPWPSVLLSVEGQ